MHCVLRVACRQMAFPEDADIFTGNATDADSSLTLDGVRCAVSESFFLACPSNLYFISMCNQSGMFSSDACAETAQKSVNEFNSMK